MSLTSFITEKDVRAKLREVFPSPRIRLEQRAMIVPLTNHYTLVGTAFDYLLCFSLQRLHIHAVVKSWIAEIVAIQSYYALTKIYGEVVAEQVVSIVEEAKHYHTRYLQTGILAPELLC